MADRLKNLALGDIPHEVSGTRKLLERLPEQHFHFSPHDRSWTLGELAAHVANLLTWITRMVEGDRFDLAENATPITAPASRQELLDRFDENDAALQRALDAIEAERLNDTWTLSRGEQTIFSMPRVAAIRSAGLNHLIHHRGQLTVYCRLLDVPLPPLYGPTADEAGPF